MFYCVAPGSAQTKIIHLANRRDFNKILDRSVITENKGQLNSEIKYFAELPGADISFQQNLIKFSLKEQGKDQEIRTDFAMQLVGANPNVQILAKKKLQEK